MEGMTQAGFAALSAQMHKKILAPLIPAFVLLSLAMSQSLGLIPSSVPTWRVKVTPILQLLHTDWACPIRAAMCGSCRGGVYWKG